jgi:Uma2 family endonuclease
MSAVAKPTYTVAEYIARETVAEFKSEYYRGQIFAMAGASPRHSTISGNIFATLRARLRGTPCRPYYSDQRIRVVAAGLFTYPDTSIICGELERDAQDHNAAVNPCAIFGVLSPATEQYDRGRKFDFYREIPTLREYILVSQEFPQVERFVRQEDGSWLLTVFKGTEGDLEISSISCRLPLAEIYEDVVFGPEE